MGNGVSDESGFPSRSCRCSLVKSGGHDAAVDDDLHFAGDEGVVATNRAWAAEELDSLVQPASSLSTPFQLSDSGADVGAASPPAVQVVEAPPSPHAGTLPASVEASPAGQWRATSKLSAEFAPNELSRQSSMPETLGSSAASSCLPSPGAGEQVVDVTVQMEYDEYDPATGTKVRKDMGGDVLRSRRKLTRNDTDSGSSSASESIQTDGTSSASVSQVHGEQDAITNWGVLIGKALWCRMKGQGQHGKRRKLGLLAVAFHGSTYINRFTAVSKDAKPPSKARGRGATRRAATVVSQLQEMVKRDGKEETDMVDREWQEDTLNFLFSADYTDTLMILASGVRQLLQTEPTVVQVPQPCKVFGDIHGQLRDMLLLFHAYGSPGADKHFVFNGDFVDRGAHQLEVVGVLFALKLTFPSHVWLVRGNHEDLLMNRKYGFEEECLESLGSANGPKTFQLFQKAFEWLPLACLIDDQILTVHGGLGDGKWTIAELSCVPRPLNSEDFHTPERRWLYNILWSDPIPEDEAMNEAAMVFGVHSSPRNASAVKFGWNVTKTFCALNGIGLVVRSHQCLEQGRGFEIMHEDKLMRVFSARDYEEHRNDAAVLAIKRTGDVSAPQLLVRAQVLKSLERFRGVRS